jgi:AraC-like DNA-binding protein
MRRHPEPKIVEPRPIALDTELVRLVAAGATAEGTTESALPGLRYHRLSTLRVFRKAQYFAPALVIVTQGRKAVQFGDREVSYDPFRYLVITGEGTFDSRVIEATAARPFLSVCLELPSEAITKTMLALADAHAEPTDDGTAAYSAELDPALQEAMVRLLKAVADPLDRKVVAPLVIEELVFRLLRTDAAAVIRRAIGRAHDAGNIEAAMRFIREHSARAISVDEVAKHVAMSPSHFAHRFRAIARVSPMRYLKQHRLLEARTMIVDRGARISEAAEHVGYESQSHFSRDFKSYFGATPAAYARRFRG